MFSYTILFLISGFSLIVIGAATLFCIIIANYENPKLNSKLKKIGLSCTLAGIFFLYLNQNETWIRKDLELHYSRIMELEQNKTIIEQKLKDFETNKKTPLTKDDLYENTALVELLNENSEKREKVIAETKNFEQSMIEINTKKIKKQLKKENRK